MSTSNRVAILLDGGYVKKQFYSQNRRQITATDVAAIPVAIMQHGGTAGLTLYRVFYYDADPYTGTATNPLSGQKIQFSKTTQAVSNQSLISQIEHLSNFAVRRGTLVCHGWELGSQATRNLLKRSVTRQVTSTDLVPKLVQKGVDMRIGLDIATLALKRQVGTIVLVTGDSDMIPAMKCARREGVRVYLDTMGNAGVRDELKVHADLML